MKLGIIKPLVAAGMVLTIFLFEMPGAAVADDSLAVLEAGGITLTKSESIALIDQTLYLSTFDVRVKFVFRNTGSSPIKSAIAFVLPDMDYANWQRRADKSGVLSDPNNFLDFKVRVDDAPVSSLPVVQAIIDGRDVTEAVTAAGLPVSFLDPGFHAAYKALTKDQRADLISRGLISMEQPARPDEPAWLLRVRFVWTQTFPVGRDLIVEHDYRPGIGTLASLDPESAARYCYAGGGDHSRPSILHYALSTGANWVGGKIGTFRLHVETDRPDQTIAACFPKLAKSGPTSYTATYRDFNPARDIELLFINNDTQAAFSADCAGVRDDASAYMDCLTFITDVLSINLQKVFDAAMEERALLDAEELKSGRGKADRVRYFDSAQKAWEEYAEAECEAAFSYAGFGPDAVAAATRCRNALIRDRLQKLEDGY